LPFIIAPTVFFMLLVFVSFVCRPDADSSEAFFGAKSYRGIRFFSFSSLRLFIGCDSEHEAQLT
jgi:hypothetical protein